MQNTPELSRNSSDGRKAAERFDAGSFYAHHGVWAPGVRLFRNLQFGAKAALISLAFLVPLLVLGVAYFRMGQATIDFARHELAGVSVVSKLEPWLTEVQKQRRLLLSGGSATVDWDAIAGKAAAMRALVDTLPDGLDLRDEVGKLERQHAELKTLASQKSEPDALEQPLQAYIDALRYLRIVILDQSNLTLDPDQDTYYLMALSTDTLANVTESVSRSRAMAGAIARRGVADAGQVRELYAYWHAGRDRISEISHQVGRAAVVNDEVMSRMKAQDAVTAVEEFYKASGRAWFEGEFSTDVKALDAPGQAAVDALRALGGRANGMLAELLQKRIDATASTRNLVITTIAVCLFVAAYLFYAFYIVMNGGLREMGRHLSAMTQGDLTTSPRPWGRDEAAALMLMLAEMQASLRRMVMQVRRASDDIVTSSSEIADGSNELSARTEQTAANLEESAAAMEQIGATVRQTSDYTHEATHIASQNATIAVRGGQVIGNMVATMEDIQGSSRRINDIIGVIDGIAFQTNILALNAAVEAARAGEQGRGFAVVASEVRALAKRSGEAAREIKELISASVGKVEAGTSVVREAGSAMTDIVSSAERINGLLSHIALGAREQSQGIGQLGNAVQELDRATQQNAAMVEETAAAASALREQAQDLVAEVSRFKLPDTVS